MTGERLFKNANFRFMVGQGIRWFFMKIYLKLLKSGLQILTFNSEG